MEPTTLVPDTLSVETVPDAPAPDAPAPDGKDWTWVLERPCPQCGLVVSDVHPREVATSLRTVAASWARALGGRDVRERPEPTTWSTLEYGAHVRDVLALADERVALVLEGDDPVFADWDQDATALEQRYDRQDPRAVAAAVVDAGEALAKRLDGVDAAAWDRPGRRSDGSAFTMASFARYVLHDVAHHLHDVRG